jgi:hypothetical protein
VLTVQLWLSADHRGVLVQVWDANEQLPQRRQLDPEAESGRGLAIVEAISDEIGVYRLERENGKIVWALLKTQLALARPSAGFYGRSVNAFRCAGWTTVKCRRSSVATSDRLSRSATATTEASVVPSGRSP